MKMEEVELVSVEKYAGLLLEMRKLIQTRAIELFSGEWMEDDLMRDMYKYKGDKKELSAECMFLSFWIILVSLSVDSDELMNLFYGKYCDDCDFTKSDQTGFSYELKRRYQYYNFAFERYKKGQGHTLGGIVNRILRGKDKEFLSETPPGEVVYIQNGLEVSITLFNFTDLLSYSDEIISGLNKKYKI